MCRPRPFFTLLFLGVLFAGLASRGPAVSAQNLPAGASLEANRKPQPQLVFPPSLKGSVTITRTRPFGGETLTLKWNGELINGNQYREVASPLAGYGLGSGTFSISGGGQVTTTLDNGTPVQRETWTFTGHVKPQFDPEFVSIYFDGTSTSPKARFGIATGYSMHRVVEFLDVPNPPVVEDTTDVVHLMGLPATLATTVTLQPGGVLSVSWQGKTVSDPPYTYTLSGTFQGAGAGEASIQGDGVIRDDPDRPETKQFKDEETFKVHGSTTPSIADTLRLRCVISKLPPGAKATRITWTVSGEGSSSYPAPPTRPASNSQALIWPLGGNTVPAKPADLTVTCRIEWSLGAPTTVEQKVQVGVRTDDVVVVGRINAAGVPLSPSGIGQDLLRIFPVDHRYKSLADQADAGAYLALLAAPTPITRPNGSGALTASENQYILNWLFRFAANSGNPPASFRSSEDVDAYQAHTTDYKLFNRAQINYHVENGQMVLDKVLHQETTIGTTLDPITQRVPDPGVSGPNNGQMETSGSYWRLTNDGSPDFKAVAAFNHLVAALGVTWNDIGSRISFSPDAGAGFDVDAQFYPTYTIYVSSTRGLRQLATLAQATAPVQNFTNPSYPGSSGDVSLLLRRHFHFHH